MIITLLWILLALIFAVVLTNLMYKESEKIFNKEHPEKEFDDSDKGFNCFLIFLLLMSFVFVPLSLGEISLKKSMQEIERTPIYSINNEVGIYGHFFIGSGTVESQMYYFYYTKGDYGYSIEKMKANGIEIVEREDEELVGYIVVYQNLLEEENWWFAFGKYTLQNDTKKVIYVPKGTVQINYTMSL